MTVLDATEARSRLHSLIDETAQTHRPIMIAGRSGNAVLLAEEDWNAINETPVPGVHSRDARFHTRRHEIGSRRVRKGSRLVTWELYFTRQAKKGYKEAGRGRIEGSSRLDPMKKVARMVRALAPGADLKLVPRPGALSNGIVEGFNGKARVTTKKAFGYRTCEALEIALYHTLGDLPEPELTHRFC